MKHESNISISILQSLDITYATIQHGVCDNIRDTINLVLYEFVFL